MKRLFNIKISIFLIAVLVCLVISNNAFAQMMPENPPAMPDLTKPVWGLDNQNTKIPLDPTLERIIEVNKGPKPEDMVDENGNFNFVKASEAYMKNQQEKEALTKELEEAVKKSAIATACAKDSDTECMPYCKYERVEECLLCPVFAVVFNTASTIGAVAITTFSNSVVRVVVVAFGIWLAIQILLFASSPETRDLKDLLQSMMTQGFLIVVVVAIIETGVANFFSTFVNPVYTTGQKMAQTMFTADVCGQTQNGVECNDDDKTVVNKTFSSIREIPNGLPQSMGNSIMQTMTMMENRISQFKALGSAMMCQSWKDGWWILPKPIYLLTGLFIWVLCMALIMGIPFLMVDSVFQLSVAAALLPIAVGCFAFKSTRQYSKKVWETFLNSMFAFLFISIVVVIVLGTIQASVTMGIKDATGSGDAFAEMFKPDGAGKTYFDTMLQSFNWASMHFIRLVFVFVLAWSVMQMAKELAGEFADSISSTSIGSSIGTMAASTAKGMALKAGGSAVKAGFDAAERGTVQAIRGAGQGVRRASGAVGRWTVKKLGKDKNGAKELTVGFGRFKRTYSLENGVMSRRTRNEEKTKIRSKDMTLVRTKSVQEINGKKVVTIHDEVKLNNDRLHKVLGRDGRVNAVELSKMLQNVPAEHRQKFRIALTKAVIEQRFSRPAHQYGKKRIGEPEIVTTANGEIMIKEVDVDGGVTFSKMKLNEDGYLETSVTTIDKTGKVKSFSSDGIRNKMEQFDLEEGTDAKSLKNLEDVFSARKKDQKTKISYGYTKFWQQQVDQGLDENKIPLGAMSAGEVWGENIITDKNGNIIGSINKEGEIMDAEGNVVGRRSWFKADIKDKDGNVISKYGDYKEKQKGGQFSTFVHSQGNEFQKGDMEYYFR